MQCATHAISKQSLIPLSGWHPGERRQSTTERKAPALSWLRKPAITINLSSDYQSDHNWINERNKSIASLLGLALKRGLISPAKVESLLTLSNSTKLIETVHNTISDIGDWMQKIGTTNTGDEVSLPAFDLDVIPLDNGQSAIVLLFRDFYAVEIPANKLPPVIASSLYIAFDMLVHLGFGCVTRDLIDYNPWYQNISDEITAIDQAGLINRPEDAWQFAMASDFECVDEIEEDCFNAFLEQYKECSELNKPVWRDGSDPIVKLNYRSQADALIERVWGWRKNNPDLYHSPWTSLIRGIAQDVRKMKDIPTEYADLDDFDHASLGLNGVACYGEAWEDTFLQEHYQYFMQREEIPMEGWVISEFDPDYLDHKLYWIARAVGWLGRVAVLT